MKNDGQFRICDHEYKLSFTGVTVVRKSDMEHLPFRKFKFVDFSTVIASHFQTRLLVGKIVCNLCINFDWDTYGFSNNMPLCCDCFRHYWCGWWSGVPICLIKKYEGCFQIKGLEVMF